MKLTKNPVFLHYYSKFMGILLFILKCMVYFLASEDDWGIEVKLGMGVGDGPAKVSGHIFEATPPGVKGHPGVNMT